MLLIYLHFCWPFQDNTVCSAVQNCVSAFNIGLLTGKRRRHIISLCKLHSCCHYAVWLAKKQTVDFGSLCQWLVFALHFKCASFVWDAWNLACIWIHVWIFLHQCMPAWLLERWHCPVLATISAQPQSKTVTSFGRRNCFDGDTAESRSHLKLFEAPFTECPKELHSCHHTCFFTLVHLKPFPMCAGVHVYKTFCMHGDQQRLDRDKSKLSNWEKLSRALSVYIFQISTAFAITALMVVVIQDQYFFDLAIL